MPALVRRRIVDHLVEQARERGADRRSLAVAELDEVSPVDRKVGGRLLFSDGIEQARGIYEIGSIEETLNSRYTGE